VAVCREQAASGLRAGPLTLLAIRRPDDPGRRAELGGPVPVRSSSERGWGGDV